MAYTLTEREYEEFLAYKWAFKLITDPEYQIHKTISAIEEAYINNSFDNEMIENVSLLILSKINYALKNNKITIIK